MKKILFAVFAIAAFIANSCTKEPQPRSNNQILVRFQNNLSLPITDARMEFDLDHVTDIGLIPSLGTSQYIAFDYFEVGHYGGDYAFPVGYLKGKQGIEELAAWSGNWCGTGVEYKQLDAGKYTIEITKVGADPYWGYQIAFVE